MKHSLQELMENDGLPCIGKSPLMPLGSFGILGCELLLRAFLVFCTHRRAADEIGENYRPIGR